MSQKQHDVEIDFGRLGGPVYIGRDRGHKAREKFALDEVDASERKVRVTIPANTYSINSSYFLGLFGPSIQHAGSREAFLEKYHFIGRDAVMEVVESGIARALYEKKLLTGDDL